MGRLTIEVWIIPEKKKILVTDFPGPPAAICGFMSEEAAQAAAERGHATVSEIGFPTDLRLGPFDEWTVARSAAKAKAIELGYRVEVEDSMFVGFEDDAEEYEEYDEYDLEEDWEWDDEEWNWYDE